MSVDTCSRLAGLRALMLKPEHNVSVFVIPSEDQHSSEYIAECDERRAWISGFNGSAGCAVVTLKEALMFTDGRYFLQASQQMDSNWKLMKQGLPDVPTWQEFICKHLNKSSRVGIDPTLITAGDAKSLRENLKSRESELVELEVNLVDALWGSKRPERPSNPIYPLKLEYSGQSTSDKLRQLRDELAKKKKVAMVITMLDEVAWLFNLRGSDIAYNPVFFSYALITQNDSILFVDPKHITNDLTNHLGSEVTLKPYSSFWMEMKAFRNSVAEKESILLGNRTSLAVVSALGGFDKITIDRSPVAEFKSLKNETEMEGFRQCHIRDGSALVRYFAWLQEQLDNGVELTEYEAAEKLEAFRKETALFKGLSFTTISSSGPNGAIIHYSPDPKDSSIIKKEQMYLCDSGGQYWDGTTDTTRTWHFGTPTAEEKRAFTRVLQGHIAIDEAIFPEKTTGYHLDPFARRPLWEDGLDYRHGTGHGVGHFLNVHEGPQGIGTRIGYNETQLKVGMTLSNEPGYYEDGKFGIRIENVVIVQEAKTPNNFGEKKYLCFEHVTMCPIQTTLVESDLLSRREMRWIDAYHEEVFRKVSPLLEEKGDHRALAWLKRECKRLL